MPLINHKPLISCYPEAMYRERLTITLDAHLLQAIDRLIDGEQLRNRSQTIEHLLKSGVGLHELSQAFFFITEGYDPAQVLATAALCAQAEITTIFLCLPLSQKSVETELTTLIHQEYATTKKTCAIIPVPADFGSGGSVILQKDQLTTPFLLAWPQTQQPLPKSLLEPFLFHRLHHATLTEFCHQIEGAYLPSGLAIASPDILAHLPAGTSNLLADTFPALLKLGKVKGYLYS